MARMLKNVALAAFLVTGLALKISDSEGPIQKVLRVLNTLRSQVVEEGKKEGTEYDKFEKFCAVTENEKIFQIDRTKKKIDGLAADIDVLKEKIKELNTSINATTKEVAELEDTKKETEDARAKEVGRYQAAAAEMDSSISALDRAVQTMLATQGGMEGTVNLAQLSTSVLDVAQKYSFVQMSSEEAEQLAAFAEKPGEAPGYTFKSGDVIAMLKGLLSTFKANKMTLEMTESENKLAFSKELTGVNTQLKYARDSLKEQQIARVEAFATKADQEEDHQDETAAWTADKKFLAALQKDCKDKAALRIRRTEKRTTELSLLKQAIEKTEAVLEKTVDGIPVKPGLLQQDAPSFLQVEASRDAEHQASEAALLELHRRSYEMLNMQIKRFKDEVLSGFNLGNSSGKDDFVTLRQTFKELIKKLQDDAAADTSSKQYCDQEIGKYTIQRDSAQIQIETLNNQINLKEEEKNLTNKQKNTLEKEMAEDTAELKERTEFRATESANNAAAIQANKEAATAVHNSLAFYGSTLMQLEADPVDMDAKDASGNSLSDYAPKVADKEYKGGSKSEGVIGILQKVYNDFTKAWKDIEKADKESGDDFDEFKKDTEASLKSKASDVQKKIGKIGDLNEGIDEDNEDKDEQMALLTTAKHKLESLKVKCIDAKESYEARKAQREKEIGRLRELQDAIYQMGQEQQKKQ
eukprot:TRINITY_DN5405_c0_g1_i1.p1 TRINITY_DN5405_c0_g1~~TRINITY_DN5405_c0_g1_i1.p1  ORF type:complete len:696 (+),score=223.06 TRINITY_DN5405_c0_g1_i1:41-2128(+)